MTYVGIYPTPPLYATSSERSIPLKKLLILALLLPNLALGDSYEPVAQTLLNKSLECENAARSDIGRLQVQLKEATAERDGLRAEVIRLHAENPSPGTLANPGEKK